MWLSTVVGEADQAERERSLTPGQFTDSRQIKSREQSTASIKRMQVGQGLWRPSHEKGGRPKQAVSTGASQQGMQSSQSVMGLKGAGSPKFREIRKELAKAGQRGPMEVTAEDGVGVSVL